MIVTASRPRPWSPLRGRNFRLLWLGQTFSVVGDYFSYVAIAWLVLQLTGSGLALGSVLAVSAIPRAVLMVFSGAVVDRAGARLALVLSAASRALLMGALAALALAGRLQLWEVYVLYAAVGVSGAFFLPARTALTPFVVTESELEPGNALLMLSVQGAAVVGPALAGALVAATGAGWAIAVDAGSYLLATLAGLLLVIRAARPARRARLLAEVWEGLAYVYGKVELRWVMVVSLVLNFAAGGPLQVGLPALSKSRFEGPAALGITLAGFAAGSLVGIVASGAFPRPRVGRVIPGLSLALGAGLAALAAVPTLALAVVSAAVMGVAAGFANTVLISWFQRRTEPALLGRVSALVWLSSLGMAPVSFAVSGAAVQLSLPLLFVGAGALCGATALAAALSPTVRSI